MRPIIPTILLCVALTADAHEGHTDRAPWDACATSALGATCGWETAHHEQHQGTCRQIGGAQMCVRNKPVLRASVPAWTTWAGAGAGAAAIAAIGAALSLRRGAAL
jgi:hypothetical protein